MTIRAALLGTTALFGLAGQAQAQAALSSLPVVQGQPSPSDMVVLNRPTMPLSQRAATVSAANLAAYVFAAWQGSPAYVALQAAMQANAAAVQAEQARAQAAEQAALFVAQAAVAKAGGDASAAVATALNGAGVSTTQSVASWVAANASAAAAAQALASGALQRVPGNGALKALASTPARVLRDGFLVPGDGGGAAYTYTATPCATPDDGSQIAAASGGCWLIDWASVGNTATPELFGGAVGVPVAQETSGSVPDATAAIQAALNTGRTFKLGPFSYRTKSCSLLSTPGQDMSGAGREASRILVDTSFSAANGACIVGAKQSVFIGRAPAPKLHDFTVKALQPDFPELVLPASSSNYYTSDAVPAGQTVLPTTNTTNLAVGQYVIGPGIPTDATITAVSANASITISAATTDYVNSFIGSTATKATLTGRLIQVSCLDLRSTYAGYVGRMLTTGCMRGVDLRGDTGQTVVDDWQGANFLADFDIDGALDTITLAKLHRFPLGITVNQKVFGRMTATSIQSGKADDLKVSDSMCIDAMQCMYFLGGAVRTVAADGYASPGGATTGGISNYNFDIVPRGLVMDTGNLTLTGGYSVAQMPFYLTKQGPLLTVSGTQVTIGQSYAMVNAGGIFSFTGSRLFDQGTNYQGVYQSSGWGVFSNNIYNWTAPASLVVTKPKVLAVCCQFTATGNLVMAPGPNTTFGAGGAFIQVVTDGYNSVVGNVTPGWPMLFPANPKFGQYLANGGGPFVTSGAVAITPSAGGTAGTTNKLTLYGTPGDPSSIGWGVSANAMNTVVPAGTTLYDYIGGSVVMTRSAAGVAVNGSLSTSGHVITGPAAPVVSNCGTGAKISGSDTVGLITTGSDGTSCTATFAAPYAAAPFCVVTDQGGTQPPYTPAAATLTITVGAGHKLNYRCDAQAGG